MCVKWFLKNQVGQKRDKFLPSTSQKMFNYGVFLQKNVKKNVFYSDLKKQ